MLSVQAPAVRPSNELSPVGSLTRMSPSEGMECVYPGTITGPGHIAGVSPACGNSQAPAIGLLLLGVTGVIAWRQGQIMREQTRIARQQAETAQEQTHISQAPMAIEQRRDQPQLAITNERIQGGDKTMGETHHRGYELSFRVVNVGAVAAWNIRIERLRLWAQPSVGTRGPIIAGYPPYLRYLDILADPQRAPVVDLLLPGEGCDIVWGISTINRITTLIDVELVLGHFDCGVGRDQVWQSVAPPVI